MHKYSWLAALALTGCTLIGGDDTTTGPGVQSYATAGGKLFGLHEPGGEALMPSGGWVVYTYKIKEHPAAPAFDTRLGAIVRLNWTNNTPTEHGGTLPCRGALDPYLEGVKTFVAGSSGAHTWVVANEPNLHGEWPTCDGAEQEIRPADYLDAFEKTRSAIRGLDGHHDDHVLIAGPGQWYDDLTTNWLQYYEHVIDGLGANGVDGIALHAYTKGGDPNLVDSNTRDPDLTKPQYRHMQWNFRVYQDYLTATPRWARDLPVYITETDQDDRWLDTNSGWVKRLYAEVDNWNADPMHQRIQAVALYRWKSGTGDKFDLFDLQDRGGVKDDFREAVAKDYGSPDPRQPDESTDNECSVGGSSMIDNGFTVGGDVYHYWQTASKRGGLAVFGRPLSNARKLVNSSGSYVCSQLFERARIELQLGDDDQVLHIDDNGNIVAQGGKPYITLGQLGRERMLRDRAMLEAPPIDVGSGCDSFPQASFPICGKLRDYWKANGGLEIFGYPLSAPFPYNNGSHTYTAQYFERARLELHPDNDAPYDLLGGLVGAELNEGVRH